MAGTMLRFADALVLQVCQSPLCFQFYTLLVSATQLQPSKSEECGGCCYVCLAGCLAACLQRRIQDFGLGGALARGLGDLQQGPWTESQCGFGGKAPRSPKNVTP